MTATEPTVEGEPVALILEALLPLFEGAHEDDGMIEMEGLIGGDSGAALIHALGRIDAELHAADMRSFMPGGERISRTAEQRRADALTVLVERLAEAWAS